MFFYMKIFSQLWRSKSTIMKTFICILVMVFAVSRANADTNKILLNMEKGHEYMYDWVVKTYSKNKAGDSSNLTIHRKVLRMEVVDAMPGKEITLKVNLLKNYRDVPNSALKRKIDYFFPDYFDDMGAAYGRDLSEELFCRATFIYRLNLKESTLELVNWTELLIEMSDLLHEYGYDEDVRQIQIEDLKNKKLHDFSKHVWFLMEHNNSTLLGDNQVSRLAGKEVLPYSRDKEGNLVITSGKDIFSADNKFSSTWLNPDNGQVVKMVKKVYHEHKGLEVFGGNWNITETNASLIKSGIPRPKTLYVSGTVSHPVSQKIHITYLERPFGKEMRKRTVFLDETNSFSIDFDYRHGGFVFIENENLNKHNPPVTFLFYAEPGDSLKFISEGNDLPRKVSFGGTRVEEAELLDEIRQSFSIPRTSEIDSRSRVFFDEIVTAYGIVFNDGSISGGLRPEIIVEMCGDAESIIWNHKEKITSEGFTFILNEVKSYFYLSLFEFIRTVRYYNNINLVKYPKEHELTTAIEFVDKLDIHDIYNDYGLFSRTLTGSYLTYYFNKIQKVEANIPVLSRFTGSWKNLEQAIQFGRIILVGSPLYREIAGQLDRELLYQYHDTRVSITHLQLIFEKHFMFMSKSVNDIDFLNEIHNRLEQLRLWKQDDYIPDATFYDPSFQEKKFHDYIGEKPAIFFVAQNWSNSRYSFDDRAAENQDIHFIMVHEGSSFREWSDYIKAAEPVANQLLLLNDKVTLIDLFEGIRAMYIVYDKDGKLLGTTRLEKQAIKMAKDSLLQKKELNKSELKYIIYGLSALIIILCISLISWKWRARQRLRREVSARRLRELELTAIRSQMNPHFLFNSLNSLQNLVQQNRAAEALSYLSDFGGIIRKVLHNSEKQEIPLADELQMVEQYLKLEQLRFDFTYHINVENAIDVYNSMVPSMLLQPLAENAILHGLQHKSSDRNFLIDVSKAGRGLKILLVDNGIGRKASEALNKETNGKGLRLSSDRLSLLAEKAGEKYGITIHDLSENGKTGTRVELFIPEES
jgi:hypothetical protein